MSVIHEYDEIRGVCLDDASDAEFFKQFLATGGGGAKHDDKGITDANLKYFWAAGNLPPDAWAAELAARHPEWDDKRIQQEILSEQKATVTATTGKPTASTAREVAAIKETYGTESPFAAPVAPAPAATPFTGNVTASNAGAGSASGSSMAEQVSPRAVGFGTVPPPATGTATGTSTAESGGTLAPGAAPPPPSIKSADLTGTGAATAKKPTKTPIQEWIEKNAPGYQEGRQFSGEGGTRWLELKGPNGDIRYVGLNELIYTDNEENRKLGRVGQRSGVYGPSSAQGANREAIPTGVPAGFGGDTFKTVADVREFFRNVGGQDNGVSDFGYRPLAEGVRGANPMQAGSISAVPVAEGGRPIFGGIALPLPNRAGTTAGEQSSHPFRSSSGGDPSGASGIIQSAGFGASNELYPDIALASAIERARAAGQDPGGVDLPTLQSGISKGVDRVTRSASGQLQGSGDVGSFETAIANLERLNQQGLDVTGASASTVSKRATEAALANLLGVPPRPVEEDPFPIQAYAKGGQFMADEPMHIVEADSGRPRALLGEAGLERVSTTGPNTVNITPTPAPTWDEGYVAGATNPTYPFSQHEQAGINTPREGTGQMAFGRYFSNAGSGEGYDEIGGQLWNDLMWKDSQRQRAGIPAARTSAEPGLMLPPGFILGPDGLAHGIMENRHVILRRRDMKRNDMANWERIDNPPNAANVQFGIQAKPALTGVV